MLTISSSAQPNKISSALKNEIKNINPEEKIKVLLEVEDVKILGISNTDNKQTKISTTKINKRKNKLNRVADYTKSLGANIRGEYPLGNIISVEIEKSKLEELTKAAEIKKIWPNRKVHAVLDISVPKINAPGLWTEGLTGEGIKIAILDTGIDKTHPMLQGKVIKEEFFSGTDLSPCNGHGTHVAGIAAGTKANGGSYDGVAPGALIMNGKVLGESSTCYGYEDQIIAGINWAVDPDGNPFTDDGADVISMSLGGAYANPFGPESIAIKDAVDAGVAVVVASGNCGLCGFCDGYFGVTHPGDSPYAITVGAVNDYSEYACFSGGGVVDGVGIKPDVAAPGVDIMSSLPGNKYASWQGTSMATPHVAGAAALLIQANPDITPEQIKALLEYTAKDLGDVGKDIKYGSGLINLQGITDAKIVASPDTVSETATLSKAYKKEISLFNYGAKRIHITDISTDGKTNTNFTQDFYIEPMEAKNILIELNPALVGPGTFNGYVSITSDSTTPSISIPITLTIYQSEEPIIYGVWVPEIVFKKDIIPIIVNTTDNGIVTDVTAHITTPSNDIVDMALKLDTDGLWKTTFIAENETGYYAVLIEIVDDEGYKNTYSAGYYVVGFMLSLPDETIVGKESNFSVQYKNINNNDSEFYLVYAITNELDVLEEINNAGVKDIISGGTAQFNWSWAPKQTGTFVLRAYIYENETVLEFIEKNITSLVEDIAEINSIIITPNPVKKGDSTNITIPVENKDNVTINSTIELNLLDSNQKTVSVILLDTQNMTAGSETVFKHEMQALASGGNYTLIAKLHYGNRIEWKSTPFEIITPAVGKITSFIVPEFEVETKKPILVSFENTGNLPMIAEISGEIIEGQVYDGQTNTFETYGTEAHLQFDGPEEKIVYLSLPKNAKIYSASINVQGLKKTQYPKNVKFDVGNDSIMEWFGNGQYIGNEWIVNEDDLGRKSWNLTWEQIAKNENSANWSLSLPQNLLNLNASFKMIAHEIKATNKNMTYNNLTYFTLWPVDRNIWVYDLVITSDVPPGTVLEFPHNIQDENGNVHPVKIYNITDAADEESPVVITGEMWGGDPNLRQNPANTSEIQWIPEVFLKTDERYRVILGKTIKWTDSNVTKNMLLEKIGVVPTTRLNITPIIQEYIEDYNYTAICRAISESPSGNPEHCTCSFWDIPYYYDKNWDTVAAIEACSGTFGIYDADAVLECDMTYNISDISGVYQLKPSQKIYTQGVTHEIKYYFYDYNRSSYDNVYSNLFVVPPAVTRFTDGIYVDANKYKDVLNENVLLRAYNKNIWDTRSLWIYGPRLYYKRAPYGLKIKSNTTEIYVNTTFLTGSVDVDLENNLLSDKTNITFSTDGKFGELLIYNEPFWTSSPSNVSVNIDDKTVHYNATVSDATETINITNGIIDYIYNVCLEKDSCTIPLVISTDSVGILEIADINIAYTLAQPDIKDALQKHIDSCTPDGKDDCLVPITVRTDTEGIIVLKDLDINYIAGYENRHIDHVYFGDLEVNVSDTKTFAANWTAPALAGNYTLNTKTQYEGNTIENHTIFEVKDTFAPNITSIVFPATISENEPFVVKTSIKDHSKIDLTRHITTTPYGKIFENTQRLTYEPKNVFVETQLPGTYTFRIETCDTYSNCDVSPEYSFNVLPCEGAKILIINTKYNNESDSFSDALENNHCIIRWNKADIESPQLNYLERFDAVVFSTEDTSGISMIEYDVGLLENYTMSGGRLLLEGDDVIFRFAANAKNITHAGLLKDLVYTSTAIESSNTSSKNKTIVITQKHPITKDLPEEMWFNISHSAYPDSLIPTDGVSVADWSDGGSALVIYNDIGNTGSMSAYLPFNINALDEEKNKLIRNIIDWLLTTENESNVKISSLIMKTPIIENQMANYTLSIKSNGPTPITTNVSTIIDNNLFESFELALGAYEEKNISKSITLSYGAHELTVFANNDFSLKEQNYLDNFIKENISVISEKPDLYVSDLNVDTNPIIGKKTEVSATIKNLGGSKAENAKAGVYIDGEQIAYLENLSLGSIESNTDNISITTTWRAKKGMHELKVIADAENLLEEFNETNNEAARTLYGCNILRIIVVYDDDTRMTATESLNTTDSLVEILKRNNYCVSTWKETEDGIPKANYLNGFDLVIWSSGNNWGDTINPEDEEIIRNVTTNIIFEGEDIAFDNNNESFATEVLGASLGYDIILSAENYFVNLLNTTNITNITRLDLESSIGPYPDAIIPSNGSLSVATWNNTLNSAIVSQEKNSKRKLFVAFTIDSIKNQTIKEKFIIDVVRWTGPETKEFSRPLKKGWNLISTPTEYLVEEIDAQLSSIEGNYSSIYVWNANSTSEDKWDTYSPQIPPWMNDFEHIDPSTGFWIYMESNDILEVAGKILPETNITLYGNEWNLVGYPSTNKITPDEVFSEIKDRIARVDGNFDPSKPPALQWETYIPGVGGTMSLMTEGQGYWIKTNTNEDMVLQYESSR